MECIHTCTPTGTGEVQAEGAGIQDDYMIYKTTSRINRAGEMA